MGAPNDKVDVCNLALGHLKTGRVTSIDGDDLDVPASTCKKWYEVTRRAFLEDNAWNFALKRVKLSRNGAPAFGYDDEYLLPDDFRALVSIGTYENLNDHPRLFQLETDSNGARAILINQTNFASEAGDTELPIRYVYDHQNIALWPGLAVMALSYALALNMSFDLRGSNQNITKLLELADRSWQRATSSDGKQRPPIRRQTSEWLRRRRYGGRVPPQYFDVSTV